MEGYSSHLPLEGERRRDSLSDRIGRDQGRELVSSFTFGRYIYGSKVVILEENTDVQVGNGLGVWETDITGCE